MRKSAKSLGGIYLVSISREYTNPYHIPGSYPYYYLGITHRLPRRISITIIFLFSEYDLHIFVRFTIRDMVYICGGMIPEWVGPNIHNRMSNSYSNNISQAYWGVEGFITYLSTSGVYSFGFYSTNYWVLEVRVAWLCPTNIPTFVIKLKDIKYFENN